MLKGLIEFKKQVRSSMGKEILSLSFLPLKTIGYAQSN